MKKTPLYEKHIELNAKLVDFAGYMMPIQYDSITKEHFAVRESAGIFDVSHMVEIIISGKGSQEFLEYITVNDITNLEPWQVQYSAMCFFCSAWAFSIRAAILAAVLSASLSNLGTS